MRAQQLLDTLEFAEKQVLTTTREIRRFCRQDKEILQSLQYMMSIPGIGWATASQLLARIGDWRQLRNAAQLGGFVGLIPSETSTGERSDRGPITQTGHGRLRSKLIEAAWSVMRRDGELREFYRSICRTHPRDTGPRIAIVAVARKLTVQVAVVLKQQRSYVG